uniref:RdRp n=1 Tax=Hubei partiti-like virus 42 TaxID=1923050 RepID=A0A1L3KLJ4_9VIRU|nr:RdRp [Hubei partiti-like virus 42]
MYQLTPRPGFGQRHISRPRPCPYLTYDALNKYTRSPVTIKLIRDDLLQFGNTTSRPVDCMMDLAIAQARRAFSLPEPVKMIHLNDIFSLDLPIWSSSPGLPWSQLGYRTKNDIRHDVHAIKKIRYFWHRIKYGEKLSFPDSCAFVRSHLVEYGEHKVRAVWGYPATVTFGEAVFAIPLIEAYQNGSYPIAYGYETAVGGARKLLNELKGEFHHAFDFKSFDKSVPEWLIRIAFKILLQNINFCEYRDYGIANAERNFVMFQSIVDYFINTKIRMCNGERFLKRGGVASGSYFTQLIDSIVNYILITWINLKIANCLPQYIKVMGDDVIFSGRKVDINEAQDLLATIGMRLNIQKSAISRDPSDLTFLGYELNHGAPSRPFDKWMAALLFPERPDKCWDDVASRAVGLLYACAACDSKFDGLCRTIINLRPFDLQLPLGMRRMLNMIGVFDIKKDPPPPLEFYKRMGII